MLNQTPRGFRITTIFESDKERMVKALEIILFQSKQSNGMQHKVEELSAKVKAKVGGY